MSVYRAVRRKEGMSVTGGTDRRGARELLAGLVGQTLETLSGRWNSILELRDTQALVATERSPAGNSVPIALVEEALDQLHAAGELRIDVPTVGYRSAFVGAVLQTLPGARLEQNPQRIVLSEHTPEWDVGVGGLLSHAERVKRFGGAPYGGIEPSRSTRNVFLYSDPVKGEAYGYTYDGWTDDGELFLYTGEGPLGDQPMTHGNRAILEHREHGRALRLFVADGHVAGTAQRQQRYVGEFEIDQENPYALEEAPDENGENRTVFVFRLRPVGNALRRESDKSAFLDVQPAASVSLVAVEKNIHTEFEVASGEAATATRRESELVDRYMAWAGPSQSFRRWSIRPPGELHSLLADIYSETDNTLFEVKGTATRGAIRTAIGQLLDYRRHIDSDDLRLAILLPHRPSNDVIELVTGLGICVVAQEQRGGFESIEVATGSSGTPALSHRPGKAGAKTASPRGHSRRHA